MQLERLAILVILLSLAAMALVGVAVVSPIGADAPVDSADRPTAVEGGGADATSDRATTRAVVVDSADDPTDADALASPGLFR